MLINTFWKILLKIVGLWILFLSMTIIPQYFAALAFTDDKLNILNWVMLFLALITYTSIIRLFVFKTEWIIEKLKLNENFEEERIDVNIKTSTILTISIIILGGLILIETIPTFCSKLYAFSQQQFQFKDYTDSSWLIFYFIKLIIGYLLLTNGKNFTNFIERNSND
ncbi:hypothetical protein [Flavobacterium aquidurense]|uniref:hypothetical protein n=1 Tax=Flavobacterium aquidurense TaxID=362413 RepID=UPI0028544B3B|nr:hypothetical protein [Flavobacterium aquidurense]MDR7371652.1 hypothetical protein [Flavobacterium aquidurense]